MIYNVYEILSINGHFRNPLQNRYDEKNHLLWLADKNAPRLFLHEKISLLILAAICIVVLFNNFKYNILIQYTC